MSNIYTLKTAFFQQLATQDPNIKHGGSQVIDAMTHTRNSFIEVAADQDGLSADMINGLHWPFVVQAGFSGSVSEVNGDVGNRYQNRLRFLTKPDVGGYPTKEQAIKAAKDLCFMIMEKWINRFYNEVMDGCNPAMKRVDFGTMSYQDIGPVSDQFYGWELSFTDNASGSNIIDFDSDYWT